jgi:hypothetical protein
MIKLVFALLMPIYLSALLTACAKSDDSNSASQISTVEAKAAKSGVFITYGLSAEYSAMYKTTLTPMYVNRTGIGMTEAEIISAIDVLKEYFNAIASLNSTDGEKNYRRDIVSDEIRSLQKIRSVLLENKSTCAARP